MKVALRSVLWVFPFVSFGLGYFLTYSFFHQKVILAPNIIGKTIQEAVKISTSMGLTIKLLREKVDADIVEGVVLEQAPRSRRVIRPNQSLFVTISKKPDAIIAPNFLNEKQENIIGQVKKLGIRTETFWVESSYPKGCCIAQSPQKGAELDKRPLVTYLSSGKSDLFIFPRLNGVPLGEVKEFLEKEGVKFEIFHEKRFGKGHSCENCCVIDQKPMAGTIVDKKLYVQLQVGVMGK